MKLNLELAVPGGYNIEKAVRMALDCVPEIDTGELSYVITSARGGGTPPVVVHGIVELTKDDERKPGESPGLINSPVSTLYRNIIGFLRNSAHLDVVAFKLEYAY